MYKQMNVGLMLSYLIIIVAVASFLGYTLMEFLNGVWLMIQQYIAMM